LPVLDSTSQMHVEPFSPRSQLNHCKVENYHPPRVMGKLRRPKRYDDMIAEHRFDEAQLSSLDKARLED
jgi:hypothetical protein